MDAGDAGRLLAKRYFQTLAGYQAWQADQADGAPFTVNPDELWTYTYDAFGRQTHVAVSLRDTTSGDLVPHRTETTAYDAQGRLITATSPEGTIHYEYDAVTGRHTRTLATTLVGDPASLITVTDTHYLYDALGRLDAVEVHTQNGEAVDVDSNEAGNQPEVTDYFYDLLGNLDQVRGPNGVIADYDYDALGKKAGQGRKRDRFAYWVSEPVPLSRPCPAFAAPRFPGPCPAFPAPNLSRFPGLVPLSRPKRN